MNKEFVYTEEVTGEIVNIPIRLLHHHHQNPRKDFGDLTELTESIKTNGIFQNLTVVPFWFDITGVGCDDPKEQADMGYLVVIGNRRLEAAKDAGLDTLPCIISNMSHKEQLSTMLAENMQRSDLTIYEQAHGFQMMLDLGDSVEDIAKLSGFSESTIRRRVKLSELDQDKLKEVSKNRQISLADFEKLNKIEDIETRNKVLEDIGTNNFDYAVSVAIRKEEQKRSFERVRQVLLSKGLKELKYSELTDGTKYSRIENSYYYNLDSIDENFDVQDAEFFAVEYNALYLRKTRTAEEEEETARKQEEAANAAAEREDRKNKLHEMVKTFRDNHIDFINAMPLKTVKENFAYIISFFIYYGVRHEIYIDSELLEKTTFPVNEIDENNFDVQDVLLKVSKAQEKVFLKAVYAMTSDDCLHYYDWYGRYDENNEELDDIYDFLFALGYEESNEEKKYRTGTHPLFAPYPEEE